jgi:hypothetical protein
LDEIGSNAALNKATMRRVPADSLDACLCNTDGLRFKGRTGTPSARRRAYNAAHSASPPNTKADVIVRSTALCVQPRGSFDGCGGFINAPRRWFNVLPFWSPARWFFGIVALQVLSLRVAVALHGFLNGVANRSKLPKTGTPVNGDYLIVNGPPGVRLALAIAKFEGTIIFALLVCSFRVPWQAICVVQS